MLKYVSWGWIISLIGTLVYFVYGSAQSWNCQDRERACVEYEEWIGNADDYRNLYFMAMALKFVVIIVFCVALFRIKRLVT